jgi:hypothetical protein
LGGRQAGFKQAVSSKFSTSKEVALQPEGAGVVGARPCDPSPRDLEDACRKLHPTMRQSAVPGTPRTRPTSSRVSCAMLQGMLRFPSRQRAAGLVLFTFTSLCCERGESLVLSQNPSDPVDSLASSPGTPAPEAPAPPGPDTIVPPPPGSSSPGHPQPGPQHVGIAFGSFYLPVALYGPTTATLLAANPLTLLADLEAARAANVRVMVGLVGNERRYRDDQGHFSFAKWKERVDRFRGINFSSYIMDGTVIGHYILDEPHDRNNWGGTLVSPAQVDELARYSKELWPSMPTIVRSWPAYLKGYDFKYLDAAWAQYSERFGPVDSFINANVQDAKSAGLGLVVGLNLLAGGGKAHGMKGYLGSKYAMSASQVKAWGRSLLANPYPCAFTSWKYDAKYFERSDIRSAFSELSEKARSHPTKGCTKTP